MDEFLLQFLTEVAWF